MRRSFLALALILGCASTATESAFNTDVLREIDGAIEQAIADHRIPGGVFHLERERDVYEKVYGNRAVEPSIEPMTADTIFDAASITKVVATTPSIWLLIERGQVSLEAPVSRYIPEFHGGWRDEIRVRHLLTHTSALRADLDLRDGWSGYDTAMSLVMKEEPTNRPGIIFRYSDINFELLGEIVHRVSGQPLDQFARKEIFQPLKMKDTAFRPLATGNRQPATRIAPTERDVDRGAVHDPTARRMGGVAGHAGLFITVADLAKYCRMILAGGAPILKSATLAQMINVQSPAGVAVRRTGGLDVDSGFSRPRGELFPLGSFGHTGFTGGFFWIEPSTSTFYIFLSNRVHPDGKGNVAALQYELGTLAAKAIRGVDWSKAPALAAREGGRVGLIIGGGDVANGIDHLASMRYAPLRGMRVGLITNHTGIDRSGNPTIDLLRSAPGVTLVALFSPEHGIRGALDAKFDDSTDALTTLPVYSLYADTRKPKPEQLRGLDALVYDIQDIGARFYTYPATMQYAMEAAAEAKVKFVVLDRVNPIGGVAVEGPLLVGDEDIVAWHRVPIRHGMTVGELARMFNDERHIGADLTVIELQRWKRPMYQDDAGLPWINTSPNMRSLRAATLYPGTGILESAISIGRGTDTPFELLGAPYIDPDVLVRELTAQNIAGVRFEPIRFTPTASTFAGQPCAGARVVITDRNALHAVRMGITIATTLHRLYGDAFAADKIHRLLRDPKTLDDVKNARPVSGWDADEAAFRARREKYLLY
jgi:uncharacterized protein YbbC (DUF1343 family)/CubicO group peptidase (beta-lactamase class C family)